MADVFHPLPLALGVAVPLRIMEMTARGGPGDTDLDRARSFAIDLAEHGDLLLFGTNKNGATADLFNRLAEAIAVLAFAPGGITIFGQHFEGRTL